MGFISKNYKKIRNSIKRFIFLRAQLSLPLLDKQNREIIESMHQFSFDFHVEINQKITVSLPRKYHYELNEGLPQSSWYLLCRNTEAYIGYGSSVYSHENGLIEGVWDGDFDGLGYADAEHVFGSGISWNSERITFTPPSYLLEGIFFLFDKNTQYYAVSNSFACLLSFLGEKIDLKTILDTVDANTSGRLKKGVFNSNPILFEDENVVILLFCYHNFVINGSGLSMEPRLHSNRFICFDDYRNYVKGKVASLLKNGCSKGRRNTPKYTPIATISSGYDSTASAAVLHDLNVKDALTIDVEVYERSDSGKIAANALDMDCIPCQHPFGAGIADLNLQENIYEKNLDKISIFLATFGMGDDSSWLAFDPYITHRIVFTGHGGDEIWYQDEFIGNGLRKITCFELSLGEYRLQKGFARVAIPYLGTTFTDYIYRLNFLKEMKPYRLNNEYDRPIPRRFAEDAGVPRECFAQVKRATNPNLIGFQKYKLQGMRKHIAQYKEVIEISFTSRRNEKST